MPLSRKELKEIKEKMTKKDQNALKNIKKSARPSTKNIKKTIKREGFAKQKSVVRWNFEVNDLVKITYGLNQIGLIVSDFEYFSSKVEKNCFFILVENTVKQIDGRYMRRLWYLSVKKIIVYI